MNGVGLFGPEGTLVTFTTNDPVPETELVVETTPAVPPPFALTEAQPGADGELANPNVNGVAPPEGVKV